VDARSVYGCVAELLRGGGESMDGRANQLGVPSLLVRSHGRGTTQSGRCGVALTMDGRQQCSQRRSTCSWLVSPAACSAGCTTGRSSCCVYVSRATWWAGEDADGADQQMLTTGC